MRLSVIIPVYNAEAYLSQTLASVFDQTLAPESFEVIAVDDGSTDGSRAVLDAWSAEHAGMQVHTIENSGSAGRPRNVGLDLACGRYVFFLDADDLLAPFALERMVDVADAQGSDVILCKLKGLNGRKVPTRMFSRTLMDADLVSSKAIYTLGPYRLVRRSMIERLELRFPEDQKVGEDQPFMAACYLNARKLSILADEDYYFLRRRDDGGNITSRTPYAPQDFLRRAVSLSAVIEKYTVPGARRDGVMKRPFAWGLSKALDPRWLAEPDDVRRRFVDGAAEAMGHLYTDGTRARLGVYDRVNVDLLMRRDEATLRRFLELHPTEKDLPRLEEGGRFRTVLPDWIPVREGDTYGIGAPAIHSEIEEVAVAGPRARVAARIRIQASSAVPDEVSLRLTGVGGSVGVLEVPMDIEPREQGEFFRLTADVPGLPEGSWQATLRVRIGSAALRAPLVIRRDQELRIQVENGEVPVSGGRTQLRARLAGKRKRLTFDS